MYLETLMKKQIKPNFWCSEEYFEKAKWTENSLLDWCWVEDEWGKVMLPPVNINGRETWRSDIPAGIDSIWSDFPEYDMLSIMEPEFLDYEYVYDPSDFIQMTKKKWATFRKNSRKWPKHREDIRYGYEPEFHPVSSDDLTSLFGGWLESFGEGQTLYDPEVMAQYVFFGENRAFLWEGNRLVGMNIWDRNYLYVNYRYCIHLNEPFLDEHLRLRFYRDHPWSYEVRVNDGGVLGSEGLERFKNKLNPVMVREVNSWKLRR